MDAEMKYPEENKKKNNDNKRCMNITIVDSVKGGCGKTTVAFKYASEKSIELKKVCVIDFDLLGSAIETFIYGRTLLPAENNMGQIKSEGYSFKIQRPAKFYMNRLFDTNEFNYINYIYTTEIYYNGQIKGRFDLMVASPRQKDKNMFKATSESQYMEQIDYGYFKSVVIKLLNMLYEAEYTHVIFDMPPNSDAYSDAVFDVLYRYKGQLEFDYIVEMFLVSSLDMAHFVANIEWLKSEISNCDWKKKFINDSEFRLVMNNTVDYDRIVANEEKIRTLKLLLQGRLCMFNDWMKSQGVSVKKIFYYDYDCDAAFSITQNIGINFTSIEQKVQAT